MPCPPNTVSYTIRQGDTLYALAAQYNTTVPAIVSANPGIDPQRLTVGQEICIPQQAVYPPCPEGNYYTIRAGDTLYAIARQFNVSLDDLLEANPGIEPFQLQVGQVICIPVATPPAACPEGYTQHTIVAGDTFFALAQRYGVTVDAIRAANPNVNPNALLIGQTLCIPPAGGNGGVCPEGYSEHIVAAGDTLFRLAQQYGVTVDAIRAANPGIIDTGLQIGRRLCIPPADGNGGACPEGYRVHTVAAGDTYFALAQRYGVTVDAIRAANPNVNPNALRIGQTLCIPPRCGNGGAAQGIQRCIP